MLNIGVNVSRACAAGCVLLLASVPPSRAQETEKFPVRVTVVKSVLGRDGFGDSNWIIAYVDGTPAKLRCAQCGQLQAGRFHGRWDKEKLRVRSVEMFGKHKVREEKYDVSLDGPRRDTTWSRDKPVLITAYGVSEQECLLPMQLANSVIMKIDHPADWRVVMACTPQTWERASLEFHNVGGTRLAFTTWDNPLVPGNGVVLTVLNAEQFDRCMRPGCYVHTILHELGHFRKLSADETLVEADASDHEQTLYQEHPASEFPSIQDLKARAADRTRAATAAAATNALEVSKTFPLSVHLLDVQWPDTPSGAVSGKGRGNIFAGTAATAFDFTTTCPDRLALTGPGPAYQGKWEAEPARLSILVRRPAPQPPYTCELRTETKPASVYQRNVATGMVTQLTQEQFNARMAAARSAAAAKAAPPTLTNADVASMVAANLSDAIVLAKISASECAFDTSPAGLRQLKAAKVPDTIVLEMIKRVSR